MTAADAELWSPGATEAEARDFERILEREFSAWSARSSASSSCFFDLLLLGLQLLLEFVNEILETFEVLLVLINLELEFANTSVGTSEVLVSILEAALFSVQFGFEFTDTLLELGDDLEIRRLKYQIMFLLIGQAADLGVGFVGLVTGIGGFIFGLFAGSLGGFVGNQKFLLLGLQKSGALLGVEELFTGVGSIALLLLDLQLQLADLLLVSLQVLLGISVGLVGVVQSNLELVDVSLELLFDAEKFGLSFGFGLEGSLH
ncbi:hypothetical protein GCK72_001455 [Caenorhabditis remanei]|uniref:Uncharacterized protein n=1 Tax=Caenorhabditis remanei TaxID=31234 RepID=A0A6A5HP01_CAERE|nr:hypothetical protein GCK72_001455 [Caenorhabditis remanei]KAF1769638.1 hypothetical protein GCK72_001455 [Caenorhabditis remanei]